MQSISYLRKIKFPTHFLFPVPHIRNLKIVTPSKQQSRSLTGWKNPIILLIPSERFSLLYLRFASVDSNNFESMHANSLKSCLTLFGSLACIPTSSSVHGILQARILEWLLCPPPGQLPDPGIEPVFLEAPALQEDSLSLSHLYILLS